MSQVIQLSKQYPPFKGGVELVAQMISRAHRDHDDQVHIVSFGHGNEDYTGQFGESVSQINRDIFIKSAPLNMGYSFKFLKVVKEREAEIIYVHLPNPYMHHLVFHHRKKLKKMGVKLVAVYHSDLANQKLMAPFYNVYFKWTSKIYDQVICSSENLWRGSAVLSKMPQNRIKVIPYCVDSSVSYRERNSFSGKLVSIGRIVPYKGFDFLVKALKDSPYQLKIIGDGPDRTRLEEEASSNVRFVGQVSEEEKDRIMSQSDVLVLPSVNRAEAYGMVIVEAFKAGLPVIASDINTGVTFLVEDEVRGKTFKIRSKEELLESLKRFEDESFFRSCALSARKFYDSELTYDRFKEKIISLK